MPRVSLEELGADGPVGIAADADALAIHELLEQLQRLDAEAARVVELKFCGGLTHEEAAARITALPSLSAVPPLKM